MKKPEPQSNPIFSIAGDVGGVKGKQWCIGGFGINAGLCCTDSYRGGADEV